MFTVTCRLDMWDTDTTCMTAYDRRKETVNWRYPLARFVSPSRRSPHDAAQRARTIWCGCALRRLHQAEMEQEIIRLHGADMWPDQWSQRRDRAGPSVPQSPRAWRRADLPRRGLRHADPALRCDSTRNSARPSARETIGISPSPKKTADRFVSQAARNLQVAIDKQITDQLLADLRRL